jgi:multiple sugar transport system permease protein
MTATVTNPKVRHPEHKSSEHPGLHAFHKNEGHLHAKDGRTAALLIAPAMILLGIVIAYPVVRAVIMSFQQDSTLNPKTGMFQADGSFAGLSNYVYWILQRCAGPDGRAIACPSGTLGAGFWNAMGVTVFFTIVSVGVEVVLGLWFATIMNRNFRGRGILRAAVLVPWAIPTAVTAKLFAFMFAYDGIVNRLFHTDIMWTSGEWSSRFAVIVSDVW